MNIFFQRFYLFFIILIPSFVFANTLNLNPETISSSALKNFNENPRKVKKVLNLALALAGQKITYRYGSANPKSGGMDCSGTIYYILNSVGVHEAPRSSYLLYQWARQKGRFYSVNKKLFNSSAFSHLKAGDLLFWSGTYNSGYSPNVSHTMIYLGKNKEGKPLMIGASNGRTYKGRRIYGVSVFDFQLPDKNSKSTFLGYSCIPGVNCAHS